MMKIAIFCLCLMIASCSTKEKQELVVEHAKGSAEKKSAENENVADKAALTFEETQDSLRTVLLKSKPNENLKASVLQELYIRGLVSQIGDKIKFRLPFNLHAFDCFASDCYSTDITFEITAKEPIEFPKTVDFKFSEHGCGIEEEISEEGTFELVEESPRHVNYYSEKLHSNLVILGDKRELYYFPNTQPKMIQVALIDKLFDNLEPESMIVPYRSTAMVANEY